MNQIPEQPKVSPYGFKRKKKEKFTFTIEDEANPGVVTSITIIEPSINILIEAQRASEFWKDFYTVPDSKTGEIPEPPSIDDGEGNLVPVSTEEDFIDLACAIWSLQPKPPRFDVTEVMILMETMEESMLPVIGKTKELTKKFESMITNPTIAPTSAPLTSTVENQEGIQN